MITLDQFITLQVYYNDIHLATTTHPLFFLSLFFNHKNTTNKRKPPTNHQFTYQSNSHTGTTFRRPHFFGASHVFSNYPGHFLQYSIL